MPQAKIKHGLLAAVFISSYLLMCTLLMVMNVRTNYIFFGINVEGMMTGTTLKPFAYRVLPVLSVKLLSAVTPDTLKMILVSWTDTQSIRGFLTPRFLQPHYEFEGLMFLLFMAASLAGYVVMLYRLARHFFPDAIISPFAAPLLGLFMLVPFVFPRTYMYDFSVLFLWAACFYALALRRWSLYLLLFVLTVLNKETAVLLVLFYGIHFYRLLPRRQWILLGLAQVGIYAILRAIIMGMFYNNPGSFFMDNSLYHQFFDLMATGYNFDALMAFVMALFMMFYRWHEKPLFLRHALWLFLPLYLLYRGGGCCGEWRVFYEIFPVLTLLAIHSLLIATGFDRADATA